MRLAAPWLLLFALAAVVPWLVHRRPAAGLRYSSVALAAGVPASRRQRLLVVLPVLRSMAIVCLAVALARPQMGLQQERDIHEGIALMMVLDRSGSMARPAVLDGKETTRLAAAKRLFAEFVLGNGDDLPGRPDDLVGMVAFARQPYTACPLTLSHQVLPGFLADVQVPQRRDEDGTAIGDAIALAAARLEKAEETMARQGGGDYTIKSKVMVLLTDGNNNAGRREPEEAADLAARWGIRIYAVALGGPGYIRGPLGLLRLPAGSSVDTQLLQRLAEATGGRAWAVTSGDELRQVYREIDQLEKSTIATQRYTDYKEYFGYPLAAALLALALEMLLANTVLRRLP